MKKLLCLCIVAFILQTSMVFAQVETITVRGVSFNMVRVEGGTFQMGSNNGHDYEGPVHRVTLSDYYIGQTEVTQDLWQAVMGSNPSRFEGSRRPVENVSWEDCQEFIEKLNSLTGKQFRLPTEAEWEFAARGGNNSRGYTYSGSNDIDAVVWYDVYFGETHTVATKRPNELGLYDMSGNVWEWCYDLYGDYSSESQTNPKGPASGLRRVIRGGCWEFVVVWGRVSDRGSYAPSDRYYDIGFRLALLDQGHKSDKRHQEQTQCIQGNENNETRTGNNYNYNVNSENETITVNRISFDMVKVDGGTFQMGNNNSYHDEKTVHSVTLSDYYIGQTEVTQELWEAVMGNNPSRFKCDKRPVENVSWEDCQEFIEKLNSLTGKQFRLPTEAEWEFAARGGNNSRGYTYSGSNIIDAVAWYNGNSNSETHPVGMMQPNELGIYDMSGNVFEWCYDWYGDYSSTSQINPKGPASGSYRVSRGGSWYSDATFGRVSSRGGIAPCYRFDNRGLRLAL